MNIFLKRFQTDAPMVPFLVDTLDKLIRYMCSKFILKGVLEKAKTTTSLIKLNMLDRNIQKVTTEVSFGLKSHLKDLKKEKKVKECEVHLFLEEVKQFLAALCNHLLTKSPISSHFARCCRNLNPVYMGEYPETCRKLFDKIVEKLVICKHATSTQADAAKNEYSNFLQTVVKKNLPAFRHYQIDENRLDEFFMRYSEGSSQFATLIVIVKFVVVLSHGQLVVERGFSTNKSLLIENLSEKSLINQRIVVDYMKSNDYKPFNIPLTNELFRSVFTVNILKIS